MKSKLGIHKTETVLDFDGEIEFIKQIDREALIKEAQKELVRTEEYTPRHDATTFRLLTKRLLAALIENEKWIPREPKVGRGVILTDDPQHNQVIGCLCSTCLMDRGYSSYMGKK